MTTFTQQKISGSNMRAPMPLRISSAELELMDQVMLRNHLRQISARFDADFSTVTSGFADIRATYAGDTLRLIRGQHVTEVARPLRLQALTEALEEIMGQLPMMTNNEAPTSLRELLMPFLRVNGPVLVQSQSFGELCFDPVFRCAWTTMETNELHDAIRRNDRIESLRTLSIQEFQEYTVKSKGSHSVLTESLCWSLNLSSLFDLFEKRWFASEGTYKLTSWPNLSHQFDHEAWLPVLVRAASGNVTRETLRKLAMDQGITPDRFRQGMALLMIFRHLESTPQPEVQLAEQTVETAASTPRSGIIGLLRKHLRSMITG